MLVEKNSYRRICNNKLLLLLGHWGFATKLMAQVCSKDPVVDRSVPDVAATVGGDGGRLHLHLQPPGSALGSRLVLTQVLMAHQVEMVGGSTSTFNHLGLHLAPPPITWASFFTSARFTLTSDQRGIRQKLPQFVSIHIPHLPET